ncbi:hypothetical protein [Amycolatopsis sp. NPDC051128]|uniref:hypothetical protein n=1 Tax=Amycolatopsis sp. NPDC051128 TaxID=3155412 RepID=UPI00342B26EE
MKFSVAGRRRARSTFTASLDSTLPGIRFHVTATAEIQLADATGGGIRSLGERALALARQELRRHFADVLQDMHPADTAAARDALCSSDVPVDKNLGLCIAVTGIAVGLDNRGRLALADYDAAAQARRQRGDYIAAQVDVVRAMLADPRAAFAWLIRQDPGQLHSAEVDHVMQQLDTIAGKIRPDEPVEDATLDDRLFELVREFLAPFLHPTQRVVLIQSLVAMFGAHGAHDLVRRAEGELPPLGANGMTIPDDEATVPPQDDERKPVSAT